MSQEPSLSPDVAAEVIASMADAVLVVDADGIIETASAASEAIFGLSPGALVGTSVDALVPPDVRPRHRQHREDYQADPSARPMGLGLSLGASQPDGTVRPIDVSLSPLADGRVLAVVRDDAAAAALRAETEQVQRLLDATDEGMFMFRATGFGLTYANQGAARMSGYERPDLVDAMTVGELLGPEEFARFEGLIRPLLAGEVGVIEFESTLIRSDGVSVPVDVLLQWPDPEGTGFDRPIVALVRDIRARRAIEVERDRNQWWAESLSDTRLALLAGVPADEVLDLVCRHACQLAGAKVAVVLEPDPDSDGFAIAAASDDSTRGDVIDFGPASQLVGTVIQAGEVAQFRAHEFRDADRAFVDALGIDDVIAAPLRVGLKRIGVLVAGREGGGSSWSSNDAEVVSSYALDAATALELARARVDQQRIARLEDREDIAADLHDMVIQRLFAAGMRLQGTVPLLDQPAVRQRVSDVVDELDETIADIRSAIFGLHNPSPQRPSLTSAVRALVAANERYLGFAPVLTIVGELDDIPPQAGDQLIPVITEALSNVARHASATRVEVELVATVDEIVLTISDDGVGIAVDAPIGRGMANLRRRATNLGGTFDAGQAPSGTGTVVSWQVRRPNE